MNPLQRAGKSLRTAREGTARTARWFGGGIAAGPRRLAAAVRRGEGEGSAASPAAAAKESGPGRFARLREHNLALWAAGVLLVAAWIAWTVYVWIENGAASGIGVLITWPAVFAALALVTSPLWATGLYMRHRRLAAANGETPAAAGGDEPEGEGPAKVDDGDTGTKEQPAAGAAGDEGKD